MLTELRIRNVAVIESVTLALKPGFNVLSGETGAGKSIIAGSLALLFGERASADIVRTGADRATVEGVFEVSDNGQLVTDLDERGIEISDQTLILKREVNRAGRSRAWINGNPVPAGTLGEIGAQLVNVHGQHDSRGLLDGESQRAILDAFGGAEEVAAALGTAWDTLSSIRIERELLAASRADAARRADYLRFVGKELGEAKLIPGEDERLAEEARRVSHAVELRQHAARLRASIDDDETGVLHQLSAAQRSLSAAARLDPALQRLEELLDSAHVQLGELGREIANYEDSLETDPERLLEVERRRDLVHRLSAKYGGSIEAALAQLADVTRELALVDSGALDMGVLAGRESTALIELEKTAARLTQLRERAGRRLEREVGRLLPGLGMEEGKLLVAFARRNETARFGAEDVVFNIALNVGHEARPLARIASGGELARIMLALKTILARLDGTPTLVFDEVDSGIGGQVASYVGDAVRRVAEHHQVLAITHLPQIASRAHHHLVVRKGSAEGVTTADIAVVLGEERVREIARMLGGDPESSKSRDHARELLAEAIQEG
ncbi:MAG: DNA repair protein RecN [Gemmatimonadota bacterium]